MGHTALLSSNGNENTAVGRSALAYGAGSGNGNTAVGAYALSSTPEAGTGSFNTATGYSALSENTSGIWNTAVGYLALQNNTTGNYNIALGENAGTALTTGCCNISIGNGGVAGEERTIRIGNANQTRAFISGIRGITTGAQNAVAVLIDSNGQLGTVSSSRRFKFDIRDAAESTDDLMRLRPVTFRYLAHGAEAAVQYGLIAEEVARSIRSWWRGARMVRRIR